MVRVQAGALMKLLANWLVKALILLLTAYFVPGFKIESFGAALIVVVVLAIFNIFLKPVLLFFTLPINILTLGLFTFVVNAILLYLASTIVVGFHISSFGTAIMAALVIALLSGIFSLIFKV